MARYCAEVATTAGLLSYWRLNEPSGTAAANQVAGGTAGVYTGGATLAQAGPLADHDYAVSLDGINDYVSVGSVAALRPTAAVTLELFFKASATVGTHIIAGCGDTGNNGYLLYLNGTTLTWRVGSGAAAVTSTFTIAAGTWYHVVATFNSVATFLYVNGAQQDTDAFAHAIGYGAVTDFHIGQRNGIAAGEYFPGLIDEVAVYSTALSLATAAAHYAARTSVRAKFEMFLELAGIGSGWTDVSADWVQEANWEQGLPGATILDRVADTGHMTMWLDNDTRNSGGKLGYYSPNHANCRSGFRLGIRARMRLTPAAVARVEFLGKISSISPAAGRKGMRQTRCDVLDWMDEAARARMESVALQEDKQGHELFQTALAEVSQQPEASTYDTYISETYPYAFDSTHDESSTVAGEFVSITSSSLALVYMDGDTLKYESRAVRARVTDDVDDFLDTELTELDATRNRENIVNYLQLLLRPRRLGTTATEVLWQLQNPIKLVPGQTLDPVMGPYVDPTGRAKRVGGTDMVAPAATTDYLGNSLENGTGSDLTASLGVVASIGGNGVRFALSNTGSSDLWVTKLQIRGRGIYYGEIAAAEASDATSQALYGRTASKLDMTYQSDLTLAGEAAQYFVALYKDPLTFADHVGAFAGVNDGDWMDRLLRRRISDRIGVQETVTGLDHSFFINRRTGTLRPDGLTLTWLLQPADVTQYWLLEVVGRGELDQTTILGFGTIVGHTDIAHGDSHTDSAHVDVTHADTAHVDAHTDTAHVDQGHFDAHSDVAHTDVAHADSHDDSAHTDVAHDDTAHVDSHSDIGHADSHGDGAPFHEHNDVHNDLGHTDTHNDSAHVDTAHDDVSHGDGHSDSHSDVPHTDTHSDAGHGDSGHVDTHTDTAHTDTAHTDTAHVDTHSDTAHGDAA